MLNPLTEQNNGSFWIAIQKGYAPIEYEAKRKESIYTPIPTETIPLLNILTDIQNNKKSTVLDELDIQSLLKKQFRFRDIDGSYIFGNIFELSCFLGAEHIIRQLIEKGVDIASNDNLPLEYACQNNKINIVRLLLENETVSQNIIPSFRKAIEYNRPEIIEQLFATKEIQSYVNPPKKTLGDFLKAPKSKEEESNLTSILTAISSIHDHSVFLKFFEQISQYEVCQKHMGIILNAAIDKSLFNNKIETVSYLVQNFPQNIESNMIAKILYLKDQDLSEIAMLIGIQNNKIKSSNNIDFSNILMAAIKAGNLSAVHVLCENKTICEKVQSLISEKSNFKEKILDTLVLSCDLNFFNEIFGDVYTKFDLSNLNQKQINSLIIQSIYQKKYDTIEFLLNSKIPISTLIENAIVYGDRQAIDFLMSKIKDNEIVKITEPDELVVENIFYIKQHYSSKLTIEGMLDDEELFSRESPLIFLNYRDTLTPMSEDSAFNSSEQSLSTNPTPTIELQKKTEPLTSQKQYKKP